MPYYKILKQGGFSEERLNRVGAIVDLAPETGDPQVERGFLEKTTKKPTSERAVKGPGKSETPAKPKLKKKK